MAATVAGPKGDVVHEVSVHDIEVQPVGAGGFDVFGFLAETGEVTGQQGGGNEDFIVVHGRSLGGFPRRLTTFFTAKRQRGPCETQQWLQTPDTVCYHGGR